MHHLAGRIAVAVLLLLPASAAHAASVRGVAVTPEGAAVPNATVRAFAPESSAARFERLLSSDPFRKAIAETVTDAGGKFSIDIKDAPVVDLELAVPNGWPSGLRAAAGEDVGAVAVRSGGMSRGRVTAGGKGIAGALVVLTSDATVIVRTDDSGAYSIPDPGNRLFQVTVIHPGHAVQTRGFSQFEKRSLDFAITVGSTVTGRAVAADRKTPVAGASIRIDGWPAGTTAEDGTFRIERVPDRWREILVAKDSRAGAANRGSGPLAIVLKAASFITGRVTAVDRGMPVAGATITVMSSGTFGNRAGESQGFTLSDPMAALRYGYYPRRELRGGRDVLGRRDRTELGRLLLPGGERYLLSWDLTGVFVVRPGLNTFANVASGSYTLVLLDEAGGVKLSKSVTIEEEKPTEVAF
jgi:hypothetical protein